MYYNYPAVLNFELLYLLNYCSGNKEPNKLRTIDIFRSSDKIMQIVDFKEVRLINYLRNRYTILRKVLINIYYIFSLIVSSFFFLSNPLKHFFFLKQKKIVYQKIQRLFFNLQLKFLKRLNGPIFLINIFC